MGDKSYNTFRLTEEEVRQIIASNLSMAGYDVCVDDIQFDIARNKDGEVVFGGCEVTARDRLESERN